MEKIYYRCLSYTKSFQRKFKLLSPDVEDIASEMFMIWLDRGCPKFVPHSLFIDAYRSTTNYNRTTKRSFDPLNSSNKWDIDSPAPCQNSSSDLQYTTGDSHSFNAYVKEKFEQSTTNDLSDLLEINFIKKSFARPRAHKELGGVIGVTLTELCNSLDLQVNKFKVHAFHMTQGRDFCAYIGHPIIQGVRRGKTRWVTEYFMTGKAARILALRFGKEKGLAFCLHLLQAEKELQENLQLDSKRN